MKEFFFSRSHNKHYSDTVVRMGKNNLGFSLVELIIVIAIMAVLAAVAIPVLGVFITKAEQNNDKQLVSDILYAIDLANESGAFLNESNIEIGDIKVPYGFIVINEDGIQVITSSTAVTPGTPCNFKTIKYCDAVVKETLDICGAHKKEKIYDLAELEITYCEDHSDLSVIKENILEEYDTNMIKTYQGCSKGTSWHSSNNCEFKTLETVKIPAGKNRVENVNNLCLRVGESEYCTKNYKNSNGNVVEGNITPNTSNVIYTALEQVFGQDFVLKLSHDKWGEEMVTYPSFYTYAPIMFETTEDLAGLLFAVKDLQSLPAFSSFFSKKYESEGDIVSSFSDHVVGNQTPGEWDVAWAGAAISNDPAYTFGLRDKTDCGNDYIWAARISYNSAFASYCRSNGIPEKYVNTLANYGRLATEEIKTMGDNFLINIAVAVLENHPDYKDKCIPDTITDVAFTNGTLATMFGNEAEDQKALKDCYELYKEYIKSDVCVENGRSVYNTFSYVSESSDVAEATGDYYAYYQVYLDEMSGRYIKAEELAGDNGIIIIVYLENGIASCEVSPSAADPRND